MLSRRLVVRVSEQMYERLMNDAERHDLTLASSVRVLLEVGLQEVEGADED